MTVVLDVSGVMQILLEKEKATVFEEILHEADIVLAPNLYIPELTNAFRNYYAIKNFKKDKCINYIEDGLNYITKYIDCNKYWQEAFLEGVNNNHSVYDMFYLVVAKRNDAILLTDDSKLAKVCRENGVEVVY